MVLIGVELLSLRRRITSYNVCYTKLLRKSDSVKTKYLKFILAYMPLCDFADNEFEFFEREVDFVV